MKYHFRIRKERDGGYWGSCVELKGCVSQGETRDELKANLKDALDLYLAEPADSKLVFPAPKRNVPGAVAIEVDREFLEKID